MAKDASYCNRQADRLLDRTSELRTARDKMLANKTILNQVWTDKSVNKINKKIDNVVKDLNSAINECSRIGNNIKAVVSEMD